jgi:hypothetical protein
VRRDLREREGGHTWTVIPAPQGRGAEALAWARTQLGAKFDRLDLLVILLDRIVMRLKIHYEPMGKYSCAEFVVRAYAAAGVTLFPGTSASDAEPADFARYLPDNEAGR